MPETLSRYHLDAHERWHPAPAGEGPALTLRPTTLNDERAWRAGVVIDGEEFAHVSLYPAAALAGLVRLLARTLDESPRSPSPDEHGA